MISGLSGISRRNSEKDYHSACLILCMMGNFHAFSVVCGLLSNLTFSKNSFRKTLKDYHKLISTCLSIFILGKFACFWCRLLMFQFNFFEKKNSGTLSECQTVLHSYLGPTVLQR